MSEKERQIALAKARIAARKNKLKKANSKTGLLLDSEENINIDTDDAGYSRKLFTQFIISLIPVLNSANCTIRAAKSPN